MFLRLPVDCTASVTCVCIPALAGLSLVPKEIAAAFGAVVEWSVRWQFQC
jgi:hypothetical protein